MADTARDRTLAMSDETVAAKTGKTWDEWFRILDAAGGIGMTHPQLVAILASEHAVSPWWQQTIAVEYEKARGMRRQYQSSDGFQVGINKTVAVPVERLYAAWEDEAQRAHWLRDAAFTLRKATPARSMRIAWGDGSAVDVTFYAKGEAKSQVSVNVRKLADAEAVEAKRAYWQERLAELKSVLEG